MRSVIFSLLIALTILTINPASAENGPPQNTMFEERVRVSGWEQNLVGRDRNLGHYYWTDMERTKRYRCNVINNVAPRTSNPNRVIHVDLKPKVIQPVRSKEIMGSLHLGPQSSSDLNGKLLAHKERTGAPAVAAYTYASYNHKSEGKAYDYESTRLVKGKLMAY